MCEYEGVNNKVIHELGHTGLHSNHIFTLCFDNMILIKPSEPIKECKKEDCLCLLNYCAKIGELHSPLKGQEVQDTVPSTWFLFIYTASP